MKKISIITPIYNSNRTLEECLDSIFNQTIFSEIELILVDDCSTDNSLDIATSYEKKAPNQVLVIHLDKNSGPGAARNVALSYASGEYIGFVDADDAVVPGMYEKLYEEAVRTNSDFVDSGFYSQMTDSAILYTSDDLSGIMDDQKKSELIVHGGYIVTKIFKRSFLNSNNIRFREAYMLEDLDFLAEIIARSTRTSNVKETFYIYRDTPKSLSKVVDLYQYVKDHSDAIVGLYSKTSTLPNYPGIQDAVEFMIVRLYSYMVNMCVKSVHTHERTKQEVLPILDSLRNLKNATVSHGYDTSFISRGISTTDLKIIKENDQSPPDLLSHQFK